MGIFYSQAMILLLLAYGIVTSSYVVHGRGVISSNLRRALTEGRCDGFSEDFFYKTKVEFGTLDSCSMAQRLMMSSVVAEAAEKIAQDFSREVSEDPKIMAQDGTFDDTFCDNRRQLSKRGGSTGLRRLNSVILDLDVLGNGRWSLCYPSDMLQPSTTQILSQLNNVETEITLEKQELVAALKAFERFEVRSNMVWDLDQAELEATIEKQIVDMNVELLLLNVTHEIELQEKRKFYWDDIPVDQKERLDREYEEDVEFEVARQHEQVTYYFPKWRADLEHQQSPKKQDLVDDRIQLEKDYTTRVHTWDIVRAKLQAELAQQQYLQDPQQREQKKFEAINEDFAKITFQYEELLETEISEELWSTFKDYKENDGEGRCFDGEPDVELVITRVLSAQEAPLDCSRRV